ncbi:MAG: hypothetical protein ACM3JG_03160 [Thiohalocapsa sp.]
MHRTSLVLVAALFAGGIGAAMAQPPANNSATAAPTTQTTPHFATAPTLSPGQPQQQNPLVNPSAAGTQTRWRGYGTSSGATLPPTGEPTQAAAPAHTAAAARDRLRRLGYRRVTNVRPSGDGGWVANARFNDHTVAVQLNRAGVVTGQR